MRRAIHSFSVRLCFFVTVLLVTASFWLPAAFLEVFPKQSGEIKDLFVPPRSKGGMAVRLRRRLLPQSASLMMIVGSQASGKGVRITSLYHRTKRNLLASAKNFRSDCIVKDTESRHDFLFVPPSEKPCEIKWHGEIFETPYLRISAEEGVTVDLHWQAEERSEKTSFRGPNKLTRTLPFQPRVKSFGLPLEDGYAKEIQLVHWEEEPDSLIYSVSFMGVPVSGGGIKRDPTGIYTVSGISTFSLLFHLAIVAPQTLLFPVLYLIGASICLAVLFRGCFLKECSSFEKTARSCFFVTTLFLAFYIPLRLFHIRDWDAWHYTKLAQTALRGELLYEHAWTNKPPYAGLLYAPTSLFSSISALSISFYCVLFGIAVLLYIFLRQCKASEFVSTAGSLTYLFASLMLEIGGDYLSLEHINNLFILLALCFAHQFSGRAVGIVGAAGFTALNLLCRQNNLLMLPWIVALLFMRERFVFDRIFFRKAAVFGFSFVGFLIVLTLASFLWVSVEDMFFILFEYPRRYMTAGGEVTIESFTSLALLHLESQILFLVMFGFLVFFGVKERKEKIFLVSLPTLFVGWICIFGTILAPQKEYLHYDVYWLLWDALVCASFFKICIEKFCQSQEVSSLTSRVLPLVVALLGISSLLVLQDRNDWWDHRTAGEVSTEIQRYSDPEESLYVFGGFSEDINPSLLHVTSERRSAHVHAHYCELDGIFWETLPQERKRFWEDLEQDPPKVIIYAPLLRAEGCAEEPLISTIERFLRERYELRESIYDVQIAVLR